MATSCILLAGGYGAVESPIEDGQGGLYFSDPIDGGVYRRSVDGEIGVVVPKRRGVGGILHHRDGGLVISGRDVTHVRNGESRIILGRDHYAALGLEPTTSFNDIFADDNGRVLAGAVWGGAFDENAKGALVLIDGPGVGEIIYDGVVGSNGIALDRTRGRLYQCSSYDRRIIVSEPSGDSYRKVGEISTAAAPGYPDGLKLDTDGVLWVACHKSNAVARFDPEGRLLERIEVPSNDVTSLCFVEKPAPALIVVTADNAEQPELRGSIFSLATTARGVPAARVTI